jgi:hypothetical protein
MTVRTARRRLRIRAFSGLLTVGGGITMTILETFQSIGVGSREAAVIRLLEHEIQGN